MNASKLSSTLTGAAVALIGVTGLIHLVLAPEDYGELPIRGILFAINGLLAVVAAVGILRGSKNWGWLLGLAVAGGALVMYVVTRSVGLVWTDQIGEWVEPDGIMAVAVEAAFVAIGLSVLVRSGVQAEAGELNPAHS